MHVILTGATGLVGSGALAQLLASMKAGGPISRVSILSRGPVRMADGKENVHVIQHTDYTKYPAEVLKQLEGAGACIWAQGISQAQVGKDEYIKITRDYPLAAARAFSSLSDPFKFIYVSADGATSSPGFFTPLYARIKGQAEAELLALPDTGYPSLRPFSVRAAFVDGSNHPEALEAQRHRSSVHGYLALVGPPFRAFTNLHSPTELLGDFFIKLAAGDGEPVEGEDVLGVERIMPNRAFRRIMRDEGGF